MINCLIGILKYYIILLVDVIELNKIKKNIIILFYEVVYFLIVGVIECIYIWLKVFLWIYICYLKKLLFYEYLRCMWFEFEIF